MGDDSTLSNDPDEVAAPAALRPTTGERFTVHEELARGGLGRILRARDASLGRLVAIKVPLRKEEPSRRRFMREALLTARLQHPSIVPVYEAGIWPDGDPFYAMKLVEGRSLKEVLADTKTRDERLALLPNLIAVADAVAYAHERHVIHRDLKPSNVLVGAFGETVVLDWGLAKELTVDDEPSEPSSESSGSPGMDTKTGAVMGTPRYMAPEQAAGRPVDERADVYALGAMLFHVLTGAPPPGDAELSPPELAAVVKKAMAPRPEDRYPSARELGDELRRFTNGQLVSSHEYSLWSLLMRFVRRHRVAVAVAMLLTFVLAVVTAVSAARVARARREAERERDGLLLEQARTALPRDPTATLAWLKQYPPGADWRPARALLSAAQSGGVARQVLLHRESAAFSFDDRFEASSDTSGRIDLWDLATGARQLVMETGNADSFVAFLPNGDLIVDNDESVWRCSAPGHCRQLWRQTTDKAGAAIFLISRDGKWMATVNSDNEVRFMDLDSGKYRDYPGHTGEVHDAAFSADGRWLATASVDHTVRVWNVATGESRVLNGHTDTVRGVRFSPDGKLLASAGHDGTVRLWDLSTGEARVFRGHQGPIFCIDFSPDGRLIASASGDRTVRLWPVDGSPPRVLTGHSESIIRVAFSPDGKTVASGGEDQTVRLWNIEDGDGRVLRGHQSVILSLIFSADGRRLLSRGFDGELRFWELTPPSGHIVGGAGGDIMRLAVAKDGRIAFASWDGTVALCEGANCRVLGKHSAQAVFVIFSRDGSQLASCGFDGVVRVWSNSGVQELKGHVGPVKQVAFTPDGKFLASVGDDHTVRLWDLATGKDRLLYRHDDAAIMLTMSPDGARLATGGFDRSVRVCDLASGAVRVLKGHAHWLGAMTFSPDSRRLASASYDGAIRVWDPASGALVATLMAHEQAVIYLAFSPDGRRLASSSLDKTARVWDLATGQAMVLSGQSGPMKRAIFSPDGRMVATGGDDRLVRLWNLATGEAVVLGGHLAILRDLAFSPDGARLFSSGNDHLVRSWTLANAASLPLDGRADAALCARLTSAAVQPGGVLVTP